MGAVAIGTLRFGVLGPLEVLRDGQPLALGGERQRALLALLLLHANELVATEQMVDELFTGPSSEGKVSSLYVAVSRLRRLLEGGEGKMLVTRRGGYVLATEPGGLDAERFESLLTEGRRLRSGGERWTAAERFARGSRCGGDRRTPMWRGSSSSSPRSDGSRSCGWWR